MVIKIIEPRIGDQYTKVPKAKRLKIMIIMWNVFLSLSGYYTVGNSTSNSAGN